MSDAGVGGEEQGIRKGQTDLPCAPSSLQPLRGHPFSHIQCRAGTCFLSNPLKAILVERKIHRLIPSGSVTPALRIIGPELRVQMHEPRHSVLSPSPLLPAYLLTSLGLPNPVSPPSISPPLRLHPPPARLVFEGRHDNFCLARILKS